MLYRILAVGDVVGETGLKHLEARLRPLRRERGAWIVESTNPLAVNPPRRHRVTSDPLPEESTDTERSADPSSQGGSPA